MDVITVKVISKCFYDKNAALDFIYHTLKPFGDNNISC